MTYIAYYLEPGEGLTFTRRFNDPNLEQDEDWAADEITIELEAEGNQVLAIEHNGKTIWKQKGID